MDFQITKYVKSRTDEELLQGMKEVANENGGKLTQKLLQEEMSVKILTREQILFWLPSSEEWVYPNVMCVYG